MNYIKKYNEFLNEKKLPDISISIEELLSILEGAKIDIFSKFKIDKDQINVDDNIDSLYTNNRFNNLIEKKKLKKGNLNNTKFNETLLDDRYILKFFFLYNEESIELEEPEYVFIQYYDKNSNKNSNILGFENNEHINSFYAKLTDATIELIKGEDTYIYQTSNGGNNWQMKNVQMESDEMKLTLDKEELKNLISKKGIKVNYEE